MAGAGGGAGMVGPQGEDEFPGLEAGPAGSLWDLAAGGGGALKPSVHSSQSTPTLRAGPWAARP